MREGQPHSIASVSRIAPRRRVIVLEDETPLRAILIQNLAAEGFEVITAVSGDEALLLAVKTAPDIIVLDWVMPAMSGPEVCRHLKTHPILRRIPIILLMNGGDDADHADAEDTGAEDCIKQPYSIMELMARLRLQLQRARTVGEGEALKFEDIVFDAEQYRVYRAGATVRLGPTEFRLLAALIERPGRVWTREQLLDRVWGRGSGIGPRTVDVHVGRLRRALGQQDNGHPLRTVRGIGYAMG